MKSRFLIGPVLLALVGALALAGTSLAGNGHGHGQRHGNGHGRTLFSVLKGRNEVGTAGDPDGVGSANVLIHSADTVCYGVSVSGIATPTEAHIHRGKRNENGPHVVTLTFPSSGDPGASSGCATGLSSSLVTEIREHPGRFYINIHTAEFPQGALRGQL
ncbi:MAG: CHRD domain-containing protein [Actinomycetota bacterium]|nr:CHRD domain-containing protein [Actinomycetota bacterium]